MNKYFMFKSEFLINVNKYKNYIDKNITIYAPSTLNAPRDNTIIFANDLNSTNIAALNGISDSIIIVPKEYKGRLREDRNIIIFSEKPRSDYAILLKMILKNQPKDERVYRFKTGYYIGDNVKIGENTVIEPFAFIDHDVTIGYNSIIKSGSQIRKNTIIGNNSIIRENCVIGTEGFGIERDENEAVNRMPHIGGVIIGDYVDIGALTAIAQGTIEPTIIEDYVQIDSCVFIAHNCKIKKGAFIIANAEISGSVKIGERSWISPNACIRDGITIGSNVTVGMGAVVTKNIIDNEIVVGNPAENIEKLKWRRKIENGDK